MSSALSRNIGHPLMNLVRFRGLPITEQLHIEENLLRTSSDNWCIINDGTCESTIVMGVSGSTTELLEVEPVLRDRIPVVRRFSGGGTVIVDSDTIFVTLICNKEAIPGLQPYPQPIMSWSGHFYSRVFQGTADFHLRENDMGTVNFEDEIFSKECVLLQPDLDYVFGERKFGGNAQSITKNRWVHHTSFLWNYDVRNMAYLQHPKRVPKYRQARDHMEFICRMKDHMPRSMFIDKTVEALDTDFSVRSVASEGIACFLDAKFSPSTRVLTRQELEPKALASQVATACL